MSYSCTNIDVAVKTEHDLAIGEILDKASNLHKSVIGAYRCEAGHESNVATLSSSKFIDCIKVSFRFTKPVLSFYIFLIIY